MYGFRDIPWDFAELARGIQSGGNCQLKSFDCMSSPNDNLVRDKDMTALLGTIASLPTIEHITVKDEYMQPVGPVHSIPCVLTQLTAKNPPRLNGLTLISKIDRPLQSFT